MCIMIAFICLVNPLLYSSAADKAKDASSDRFREALDTANSENNYQHYLAQFDNSIRPNREIIIEAEDYIRAEGVEVQQYIDYKGMEGISVLTGEQGQISYEVNIQEEGLYHISLLYYPIAGKSASIQRAVFIDDQLPYAQLGLVEFSRVWVNAVEQWEQDNRGNDLKPQQIEAPQWIRSYCYDSEGYETEELAVFFTRGTHTITLYSRREPMLLRRIILDNPERPKEYRTVLAKQISSGAIDTQGLIIEIQAENANRKSSQMLYPIHDKSSPAVMPYSANEMKNCCMGSNGNWRIIGQWLEWDFDVPQSGFYSITLHQRQNFVRGIYTSRKIMIDGVVPFKELGAYGFVYNSRYRLASLSDEDDEAFRFFLEKGKHTLKMEVVLGDFAKIIGKVREAVRDINAIYLKVIRITGVQPDKYRDYNIKQNIPHLAEEISRAKEKLEEAVAELRAVAGQGSDREAALNTMIRQLNYLAKDVERFPSIIQAFKVDMSALGNWIAGVMDQPLALDAIYIHSPGTEVPKPADSLWDRFLHTLRTLYYSFIIDYNTIGNVAEGGEDTRTITVWIGSGQTAGGTQVGTGGRDQANVVKALIDQSFTPKTNINVNLQLVDMSMLLQATLAGQGPDVAIQVANDIPMNYGMRSAVADLSRFDELEAIKASFRKSAMVPFEFGGHTFALPETETCLMMFYRKDILNELGLQVPATWDEVNTALSVLAKNQMDLGMLPTHPTMPQMAEQVYAMFLYQNGGQYYNEDATASALDSDIAIRAFRKYCEYYTDYKIERDAPVDQRFRTGEAPIVISDFTLYNQLQVSAPDIKGLWGFTMVPGTVRDDGSVNYSVSSTGTATMMMSQTKDEKASWEFMKWWVSADIQAQYGQEMEAVLGPSARYPTANVEAFGLLPWPYDDYQILMNQFAWMKGIPQVPGGYYSWRNVNNAFYRVVLSEGRNKMQPREAMTEYVRYINDEITFKRIEFGLPKAE
ncbi:MAG: extracellular solute-binding protein [Clostridiaceae bacterium]|nr:extracellular solute-binding protein [Clostridiaceae bacterium]